MFLYENNKCPVCDEYFQQGDDVVVCPECGTPHHRECYNKTGKCTNKKLHGSDFVFEKNKVKVPEPKKAVYYDEMLANADAFNELSRGYKADQNSVPTAKAEAETINQSAEGEEEIDGVKISDIRTVVGANSEVYIKKFSKKGKLGWNWSAFFFGSLYFMVRKMYAECLILLALPMVINAAMKLLFSSAFEIINNLANEMITISQTGDYNKIYEFLINAAKAPENKSAIMVMLASSVISLLITVVFAVIADYRYRRKVVGIVKTVDEKLSNGSSFMLSPSLMGNEEMSPSDIRKWVLSRQGGVSLFLPLMLVSFMFISYIMSMMNI